jgi:hypothetical protein
MCWCALPLRSSDSIDQDCAMKWHIQMLYSQMHLLWLGWTAKYLLQWLIHFCSVLSTDRIDLSPLCYRIHFSSNIKWPLYLAILCYQNYNYHAHFICSMCVSVWINTSRVLFIYSTMKILTVLQYNVSRLLTASTVVVHRKSMCGVSSVSDT